MSAFTPRGSTYALSVVATSTNVQVVSAAGAGSSNYLLQNPSANPIWFASAPAGTTAPVALVAVVGTPGNGICLPAGTSRVVVGPGVNAQWAAIALVAGPSLAYVTAGDDGVA